MESNISSPETVSKGVPTFETNDQNRFNLMLDNDDVKEQTHTEESIGQFPTSPYLKMNDKDTSTLNIVGEDEDDIESMAPSIVGSVGSVLTADEVSDVTGFYIVCFVILLGDMSRGIMFPTLWPLVRSLGGTEVTQGYAVGAFSFGRILVSPIFGSWSAKYGYKRTLLFSSSILMFGTLLYSQVQNMGSPEFLILAQTGEK